MADLTSILGPFSSALGGNSFPSSYGFTKRFINNAGPITVGTNGVTSLDDPTYLGFELMFDITSPLFMDATKSNPAATAIEPEPVIPGSVSALGAAVSISSLGGAQALEAQPSADPAFSGVNSAIGYLLKIGEGDRAQFLKAFIQGMQEIVSTRPYYFQTIAGLIEGWNKSTDFTEDPYTGTTGTEGVSIGCLEAIDLKITALFSLYRMAVYDTRMKRFVLPKNLMQFDVYINVHEIRKFKTTRNWLRALNPSAIEAETSTYLNENTSNVRFKFTDCIWDVAASGKAFENVTNVGGEVAVTEIKFGYGDMQLKSSFSGLDFGLDDGVRQGAATAGGLGDRLKSIAKDQAGNMAAGAQNKIKSKVNAAIQGVTLGNVFGLRNELLGTLANPQSLINAATGAAVQSGVLETFGNAVINTSLGDNPLGDAVAAARTINTSQAFDPSNNSLGGLNSINAFGPSGPAQGNGGLESTNIFE